MDQIPVGQEVFITTNGPFCACRGIEGDLASKNRFFYVDDRNRIRALSQGSWTTTMSPFTFDQFRNSSSVCIRAAPNFEKEMHFSMMKRYKEYHVGRNEVQRLQEIAKDLLRHDNILFMEHAFKMGDPSSPSLHLTTKLNYMNIVDALMHHGASWTIDRAITIMGQISEAIDVLHKKNIAHLDIRCENFVFEDMHLNRIKLIDFEMSQTIPGSQHPIDVEILKRGLRCGYPLCMPPETFPDEFFNTPNLQYGLLLKKDVWGAGMVFFYLLTRLYAFGNEPPTVYSPHFCTYLADPGRYLLHVLSTSPILPSNDPKLHAFINLLQHMLHPDTDARYTIKKVKEFMRAEIR